MPEPEGHRGQPIDGDAVGDAGHDHAVAHVPDRDEAVVEALAQELADAVQGRVQVGDVRGQLGDLAEDPQLAAAPRGQVTGRGPGVAWLPALALVARGGRGSARHRAGRPRGPPRGSDGRRAR